MDGLVGLVIDKYDGSLKAEHGTGINMAPFVEREWGAKATELMRRVKRAADPDGVLAPGASTRFGMQLAGTGPAPVLSCDNGASTPPSSSTSAWRQIS